MRFKIQSVPVLCRRHLSGVGAAACAAALLAALPAEPADAQTAPLHQQKPKRRRNLVRQLTEGLPEVHFLHESHIEKTVTLLNAIIDLPSFSDE
jgi:hypothetical protein